MRIFGFFLKKCIKQTIIPFLIFFLILVGLTQIGIEEINSINKGKKNFGNLEDKLIEKFINFHQYGNYGIRIKFSPEPITALFLKTSPFIDINTFMDVGARLWTYSEVAPSEVFSRNGYLDFFWFLMVVGSLLVAGREWNTHNDEVRMRFLISVDSRSIFKWKLLSRMTLIFLMTLVIYGQILIQFLINGYSIDMGYLGIFLGVVYLVYIIWFLLAAFMGCGNKKKRKYIFAIIWIVFVMLLPEIFNIYFDREAKVIIICKYRHELKRVEILMRFEKKAYAKASRLKTKEERFQVSVESAGKYLKIDAKELERLQKDLLRTLNREIGRYNFISQFTPMTWLKTTAIEISTQGFRGYKSFHQYSLSMQMKFLKFIMDKLYLKAPNYGPVHSFQKEGENIFRFKSTLPGYFLLGVLWHIALVFLLVGMNYLKSKKLMFKDEREKINDPEIIIKEGVANILLTIHIALKQHIFSYFVGKTKFKGKLTVKTSKEAEGRRDFIYLYKKEMMDNDFTPDEMRKLLNEHGDEKENWKIIFNHAKKKNKVLILDEFFNGVKEEDIEVILEEIKNNKILSLIITGEQYFAFENADVDNIYRMANDSSVSILKKLEKRLKK